MKRIATLSVASLFFLSGCAVVHVPVRPHTSHGKHRGEIKSSRRECHPSQYWDGEKCRHKGKGKGARKHDD